MRVNDHQALKQADQRHHFHPFTDHRSMHEAGEVRVIERGEGCWIIDIEGRRILDGMAGLWCVNVGYGRTRLGAVAQRQMETLPYYNTFFKTSTLPATRLADKLASLLPAHVNRVFFGSSGSDANDTVLRLVRTFWQTQGKSDKRVVISRHKAYHGSTVAASSLGGMGFMHAQAGSEIPDIHHIMPPYGFEHQEPQESDEAFGLRAAQALEDAIVNLGPERVAAFIGEPIMGAGGVFIPPQSYWPAVEAICRKYDVLLCADEVICGFGRTGNWFGFETFGFTPDIVTMAKGLSSGYVPLSAVGVCDRVAEALYTMGNEFAHGYTYSGHPVACAVALENIAIMEEERLIEQVRKTTGPYFQKQLATLSVHPLVAEVRACALIGAFELAVPGSRNRFTPPGHAGTVIRDLFMAHGCIMRACGDTMVTAPPLIISTSEIDHMISTAQAVLDEGLSILQGA